MDLEVHITVRNGRSELANQLREIATLIDQGRNQGECDYITRTPAPDLSYRFRIEEDDD
jgi:hypothetical protein